MIRGNECVASKSLGTLFWLVIDRYENISRELVHNRLNILPVGARLPFPARILPEIDHLQSGT